MTTTQRTYVATHTAGPDEAGWRFGVPTPSGPGIAAEAGPPQNPAAPLAQLASPALTPVTDRPHVTT